jgi:hypothetical protein
MPVVHSGRRYQLLLYTYMINRWWRPILTLGIILLVMTGLLGGLPLLLPQYAFPWFSDFTLMVAGGVGALAVLLGVFLITIRKSAYVQPFDTHLRLVTPFLRMNISYRRLRQTTSAEMGGLFPPQRFKGSKRAILEPLARQMVIVLELNGWPLPPRFLHFFLSPFFFPDKTPRLALMVPDWLKFSVELESFRSAWGESLRQPVRTPQQELLSSLKSKR